MPFGFRRKRDPDDETPAAQPADARRPVVRCAGCGNVDPLYVYMSNGKDYCRTCARRVSGWLDVEPAGTRSEDATSLDPEGGAGAEAEGGREG